MEVVGHGVVVDLAETALLGADAGGEVAEMVDRERQVGGHGLADRLAVVEGLDRGQGLQPLLHPVGDPVQELRTLGDGGAPPFLPCRMRGVECQLDVLGRGTGHRAQHIARNRGLVVEVLLAHRGHPAPTDEVVVARPDGDGVAELLKGTMKHCRVLPVDL